MKKNELPRREEFLNAALTRFAQFGYVATSTRQLCADLDIVPSAIYNYFPSKEAVVLAIEEREMTAMLDELNKIETETQSRPLDRLIQIVSWVFSQAVLRRESWRLMADVIRSLKPENRVRVVARRDAVEKIVRDALATAIAADLVPSQDIKLASLQMFSMAEGMSGWYRPRGSYSQADITAHAVTFFLRAIGAAPGVMSALGDRRTDHC